MSDPAFPIQPLLPRIRDSLARHPRLVLEAPPGAGKTTQVPPALLDAVWLGGGKIVMLEPRRVAARAAAGFMAQQRGEAVGDTVGYRIRFEQKISARTRIEVVTEGILTRMLQDDPMLDGIGALLFDEFHERHLAGDLGLALALDVQASLRPDLRIVVMSATLDGEKLAQWLDAPRLASTGRSFPVSVSHFAARRDEALEVQARRAVEHALAVHPGDVLVFLPGQREIARVRAALSPSPTGRGVGVRGDAGGNLNKANAFEDISVMSESAATLAPHPPFGRLAPRPGPGVPPGRSDMREPMVREQHVLTPQGEGGSNSNSVEILALHGELPVEQQTRVLQPSTGNRRRVVLATNVAESSVTLPGVRVVVDSGLAREPRFDPNSGFSRLETVRIAQASADQRAGRAGRVAEGWAYRLWPPSQRLEPQRSPEIAQVDLAALALELASWGSEALRFVDPPPAGALAAARDLLRRLGALAAHDAGAATTGTITALGRRMLALGTHPRLAAMLLSEQAQAADAAAASSAADAPPRKAAPRDPDAGVPRRGRPRADGEQTRALACDLAALLESRDPLRMRSDALADRWQALAAWRCGQLGDEGSRSALAAVDAAAAQWRRRLRVNLAPPREAGAHALGALLAHAFPDRIGYRHDSDRLRYQLANGRMLRLFEDSRLIGEPWLVACELRFESRDALLLRGVPVDEAALHDAFCARFSERDETRWDGARRALVSARVRRFDGIVLQTRPAGRVDPEAAAEALTEAVAELGLEVLPWNDALRQWRARVSGLRAWMPEFAWPDLSDDALLTTRARWLRPAFTGLTRLDALSEEAFAAALKSNLDGALQRRLDALAPVRIAVPSGQVRAIAYAIDAHGAPLPPVLAVKLQELFGLADTPRIADGRVPLTLHLLSPAGRPLQVTQDLRGFWERTYPEVRKEMKGRYPRHPWPEDPWLATATHRAKPRGG